MLDLLKSKAMIGFVLFVMVVVLVDGHNLVNYEESERNVETTLLTMNDK